MHSPQVQTSMSSSSCFHLPPLALSGRGSLRPYSQYWLRRINRRLWSILSLFLVRMHCLVIQTRCWSSLPAAEFPCVSGGSIEARYSTSRRLNRHVHVSQPSYCPHITVAGDERYIVSSLEEATIGAALLGTRSSILCVVGDALKCRVLAGLGGSPTFPQHSWTSPVWEMSIANNPRSMFFDLSLVRRHCPTIFVLEWKVNHGMRRVTCGCMMSSWDFLLVFSVFSSFYSFTFLTWMVSPSSPIDGHVLKLLFIFIALLSISLASAGGDAANGLFYPPSSIKEASSSRRIGGVLSSYLSLVCDLEIL